METIKLKIEHKGAQMNLYKIKKYDTVKVGCGDMDVVLHENMWIGCDPRHMEYVIYAENPCEIWRAFPPIISNDIILTFTNEMSNQCLCLCCNGDKSAITFDQEELRWKIYISVVQSKFVKEGLRELFDDAKSEWLNLHIAMDSFYGLGLAQKHLGNSGLPEIKDVIFNAPATIVLWADGTKTVVKAQEEEDFDLEKGLAMAIVKKALGNEGKYYETIKKWINKGGKYL